MTRRLRSIPAIAGSTALMLAGAAGVAAQDVTDTEHPFVGAWVVDATPAVSGDEPYVMIIAGPGGTLINDSLDGLGYGAWGPTGESTAILTILTQAVDPDTVDPDTGYGFITIRASVDVAPDGQSFTGTWTIEFPPGFGQGDQEYGPGEVSGERIDAEDMGTPVGPIP